MAKTLFAFGFLLLATSILFIVVTNQIQAPQPSTPTHEVGEATPLQTIQHFAADLCGSFSTGGSDQSVAMQGDVEAKLKGVLEKLTDLGVSGTAKFNSGKYVGVLREELGKELQSVRDCKLSIFRDLKVTVVSGQNSATFTQSTNAKFVNIASDWVEADDLSQYTKADLRLIRNEYYARYGYRFKSADLRKYFSAQPWYTPNTDDASVAYKRMTAMERSNVLLIKDEEARR